MRAKKVPEVKNVGGFALEGNLDGLVLFAKVGWMKFYNGPRPDDLKPIGGGLNNRKNFGHEGFNFRSHQNRLLGFVSAPARGGKLDLQRIDPSPVARSRIRGATVIFIATEPRVGGQKIVGWYRNATIHALRIPYNSTIRTSMMGEVRPGFPRFKPSGYQFESDLADATLLPLTQRHLQRVSIPKKHGIGEANVCYPFDRHGKANPQKLKWVREALEYVSSYSGPNLLSEDGLENELGEAVSVARESGAGFQSDPRIRKEIEEYAMECARKYLIRRKYKEITRTDDRRCYDFTCRENGKTIYVEVKGSQTGGEKVIITKNEKGHLESNPNAILYVRHSVDVAVGRRIRVSGGTERVLNRWDARSGSFAAAAYIYTLPVRE
jgi:Domain of unknown function (DUF3883)